MVAEDGKIKSLVQDIPADVTLQVGDVIAWAANSGKYEKDSWKTKPTTVKARIGSAKRHILKYLDGQELDDESDLPHLTHAITQLMMAQSYINRGIK